jgi:hypothetical protein
METTMPPEKTIERGQATVYVITHMHCMHEYRCAGSYRFLR